MTTPEARLTELGLELPPAPKPAGSYVLARRSGSQMWLAGHGPFSTDGKLTTGKLGADLDVEAGQEAAKLTALNLLSTLQDQLGSLERVAAIVKLVGMVNCTPEFDQQPAVINGASNLLFEVLGEAGRHARSAVGMASLPFNMSVEIELVAEVTD
ncbi:MAG: RidA family protein [Actinomycetota bacterium]|nr:RidA family protein [Actinomycetota bacterium]